MISLSSVLKRYSSQVAIGPIDLQIPTGGITALVGPNGAGKSTLMTILGARGHPTTGSVDVLLAMDADLNGRVDAQDVRAVADSFVYDTALPAAQEDET